MKQRGSNFDRSAWLEARRKGIGGSDVAAIIGLSEWESPYSIWADKLGYLPPKEENEAMRQGRDFEDYVARRFCEATGKKVRRVNRILQHSEHYFMLANIDRDVVGENAGLECKTTSVMNLKKFKNGEYPENYYCQCMHYMAVTGASKWYLAVLILNKGFHIFEIERDDEEIAALIAAERAFWTLVENEMPPAVDGLDATRRAIEAVHPTNEDAAPTPLFEEEDALEEWERLRDQKKVLENSLKGFENHFREALRGSTRGVFRNHEIVLQTIKRDGYTVKPSEYTQLKVKERKTNE